MNHPHTFRQKLLRAALGVLIMEFGWFALGFFLGYFFMTPFPPKSQFREGVDGGLLFMILSLASGPLFIRWWKKD
jgi:hypothetical protein